MLVKPTVTLVESLSSPSQLFLAFCPPSYIIAKELCDRGYPACVDPYRRPYSPATPCLQKQ